MKILYCISSFSAKGGTEKVLSSKAAYLAGKGHDITILISDQHNKPYAYDLPNNVTVKDLKVTGYLKNKLKGVDFFRNIITLRKIYSKEVALINPDIIIVLERGYEDFVVPYINVNIPKIREFHTSRKANEMFESYLPFRSKLKAKLIRRFYQNQYKKYDAFVCLTEKDKHCWQNIKNVYVIPNVLGCKDDINQLTNIVDRPKKIIAVGSMVADRKGFNEMIDIWSELEEFHDQWHLHIYGDGPYREIYQQKIENLALNKAITLEGVTNNLISKYQESQIFLMTSKGEGFPMVMLEAQQNAVPVIAYDCHTGPSDILKDDIGGFLIPMNNREEFKIKLTKLLENNNLREMKSREAIKNATRYNPKAIIPMWEKLFIELVSK